MSKHGAPKLVRFASLPVDRRYRPILQQITTLGPVTVSNDASPLEEVDSQEQKKYMLPSLSESQQGNSSPSVPDESVRRMIQVDGEICLTETSLEMVGSTTFPVMRSSISLINTISLVKLHLSSVLKIWRLLSWLDTCSCCCRDFWQAVHVHTLCQGLALEE